MTTDFEPVACGHIKLARYFNLALEIQSGGASSFICKPFMFMIGVQIVVINV